MEPVNPLLPAHRLDASGLLRRTGGLINAVRGIRQEANAEYWYELAMTLGAESEIRLAYMAKCEGILRHEIATIRRNLENDRDQYVYQYYESDGDGGTFGPITDFDTDLWYDINRARFDRLFKCYRLLVESVSAAPSKADIWIELAEFLRTDGLQMVDGLSHFASECYRNSFNCDNRLETILRERESSNTWFQGWDPYNYGAILSREQTIEKFPKYPGSYYSRGLEKSEEGRYEDALNDLNLYESLNGDIGVQFYRHRGWLHHQLGNTSSACQDAVNVLRLGGKFGAFLDGDWSNPDDPPF